jgi:flagellin-like hook-associated protein FlgL
LAAGKNSAIRVFGTMNVNDGAYISANYINVTNNTKDEKGNIVAGNATLNLNKNCLIRLSNKNVINVNNLVTDNSNQGQIELAEDNAVAVIKADKFENNGNERILSFKTSGNNSCFLFQFTKCFNGSTELNTFEDLAIQATYIDYDKTTQNDMVDYKDENNTNYGYEWKGDASLLVASKKLDLIASSEDPSAKALNEYKKNKTKEAKKSQDEANKAIEVINAALESVSAERARYGAMQNRLEHTINNLKVSEENLQSAESRIRDADMANEIVEFSKNKIIAQSGTAMLAQANAAPQGILQLLNG